MKGRKKYRDMHLLRVHKLCIMASCKRLNVVHAVTKQIVLTWKNSNVFYSKGMVYTFIRGAYLSVLIET